jgi:uncharacterized membrane protein YfcA
MDPNFLLLLLLLALVATLYAAVGHGGGSSYLALFVLFNLAPEVIRPSSLTLNIIVAGIAAVQYYRAGQWHPHLLLPFLAGSIPAAFWGGSLHLDATLYKHLLGVFLLLASLRLFLVFSKEGVEAKPPALPLAILIGLVLGFLSGILGIGGGIILSPLIILAGWGLPKAAASSAAFFILLNSMAGLAANQWRSGTGLALDSHIWQMASVVLVGAIAGSYWGSKVVSIKVLNRVLGLVTLVAGLKLLG